MDFLYRRPDIQKEMEKYVNAVGEMQHYHGKTRMETESAQEAARKDMHNRICNRILKVVKDNYHFSVESQINNLDQEMKNPEGGNSQSMGGVSDDLQGGGKGGQLAKEDVKGYDGTGMFDINMSYVLVKAALEEMRKQSLMQKSRASGYSRQNRSHSRQSIKEEIRKDKDNSRELL